MTAQHVADEAALREALHAIAEFNYDECDHGTYMGGPMHGEPYEMCARTAKRLLASGLVQPREDAVREAKAEALREAARDCWHGQDDFMGAWLRDRARTALTPGTDRPAVEDGPRNTGTGSATP